MCLGQGPQRSDAGEARNPQPLGLQSSTLSLSHCAPTSEIDTYVESADPDQTAHMSSLIRIFTVCHFNKVIMSV